MPQGQQRRNNARGRISPLSLPRQDMLWTVTARTVNDITIMPEGGMDGLIGSGILNAEIVETGVFANAQSLQSFGIFLNFPSVPVGESTLRITANDPAVRNHSGGFLVGAEVPVNPPTPQPPSAMLTGFANAEAVMNQCVGGDSGLLYILLQTPHNHEFYLAPTGPYSSIVAQVQSIGILGTANTDELWSVLWDGTAWVMSQII